MVDPKRKTYRTRSGFGHNAPPGTMPFPRKANLTAVELLAFFPNTMYRADVIYRMISNSGTRKSIWAIVNSHRDLEAEWSANCCGEAMYKTMQKAGYTDWTIKKHDLWHASRRASWDGSSLAVGNLQTAQGVAAMDVPFKDLAADVRMLPEGDDALDLTKMVQYCVQNSEDGWRYPEDYEELLELLGGSAKVRNENTDEAVFGRWENKKPPPPLPRLMRPPQGIELLDGWKKAKRSSSLDRRRSSSRTRLGNLSTKPGSLNKRRAGRERAQTRPVDEADTEVIDESQADGGYSTPYARQPAKYVTPPPGIVRAPAASVLAQVFQAEGAVGESDPYSAYAFGGPRSTPPYRYLSQIAQPHPWDIGGWAENLRWAFEQRILFAQGVSEASRWNESPEHMACIERERTHRVWASDELLEQMLEGE